MALSIKLKYKICVYFLNSKVLKLTTKWCTGSFFSVWFSNLFVLTRFQACHHSWRYLYKWILHFKHLTFVWYCCCFFLFCFCFHLLCLYMYRYVCASLLANKVFLLAWVVQKVDNAIDWINHYPVDNVVHFVNTW